MEHNNTLNDKISDRNVRRHIVILKNHILLKPFYLNRLFKVFGLSQPRSVTYYIFRKSPSAKVYIFPGQTCMHIWKIIGCEIRAIWKNKINYKRGVESCVAPIQRENLGIVRQRDKSIEPTLSSRSDHVVLVNSRAL